MALTEEVMEQLRQEGLAAGEQQLARAALQGSDALEALLDHGALDEGTTEPAAGVEPVSSVYLTDVSVTGFRGIGETATLEFSPGPGLTVVVGRNGSGKSSFSDALEVLLTGDSYRWKNKTADWKEGWRNLHLPHGARVTARFQVDGVAGHTTVERTWADDVTDVTDAEAWAQHHGRPRTDLDGLGWTEPLTLYRPLLSYTELGIIGSSPSALYDALSGVLGLEELTDATAHLRQARLAREQPEKDAKKTAKDLSERLKGFDDERARSCHAALTTRGWDLDAIERVVTGEVPEQTSGLRALAEMEAPTAEQVRLVVAELREARARMVAVEGTEAARARRVADLLRDAFDHHRHDGDGPCPVCGAGTLDPEWAAAARAQIAELEETAARYDAAATAMDAARARVTALVAPPPLPSHPQVDTTALVEAWKALAALGDDPDRFADRVEEAHRELVAATTETADAAAKLYSEHEELWRPLATELAAWLTVARQAQSLQEPLARIKAVEEAMKKATTVIRAQRFDPISRQAMELWGRLRLQSNVDLASVDLAGAGNRRWVDLQVTVDGSPARALGVVSQGEINCLALSLFFPRATLPDNPFRFVVIDDPVQAMDPARVDGLAQVLSSFAADRQVIVFTHDDRLPESLHRLGLPHSVAEVMRRAGSRVEVRKKVDPVAQYFRDAWAVAKDDELPDDVAERVVPGICRMGLEAACVEAVRKRRLSRGDSHRSVEDLVERAGKLSQKASLALFDNADEGGRVVGELERRFDRAFGGVFRDCNSGVHRAFHGSLTELTNQAGALAERIRTL